MLEYAWVPAMHLFQLRALFVGENGGHLAMGLRHRFVNALRRFRPDVLQIRARFVHHWRNFCDLFRREFQFPLQTRDHSFFDESPVMSAEKEMTRVRGTDKSPSYAAGDEDEEEPGYEFPLQGAVHR